MKAVITVRRGYNKHDGCPSQECFCAALATNHACPLQGASLGRVKLVPNTPWTHVRSIQPSIVQLANVVLWEMVLNQPQALQALLYSTITAVDNTVAVSTYPTTSRREQVQLAL